MRSRPSTAHSLNVQPAVTDEPHPKRENPPPTANVGAGFDAPAMRAPGSADQLNESPQAQEPVAFGLSMVKPCCSMVSAKSIFAPIR